MNALQVVPEALAILGVALYLGWRWWQRPALPDQPLPAGWPQILSARLPHLALLDATQRPLYAQRVEEFLRRKRFIGCNGFQITDEVRVLIAGLACLLVLRPEARVFPLLRSVLVYPEAFLVPQTEPDEFGLVSDEPHEQVGESWSEERVILSWADVEAALAGDEVNVVAHEFAHQLDDETPAMEGAPALQDYERWSAIMQQEFERLRRHRRPPVLDPYGAESPAEFFAVVTEAFFQRGALLQKHHAELYALLREYYRLDTARLVAA
jgi:MtfA peptidase